MNTKQKMIYGAVMALAVLVTAELLDVGTLSLNVAFAIAMGLFAMLAVAVAARIADRTRK